MSTEPADTPPGATATGDADESVVVSWPRPSVAQVTLSRPGRLNALTFAMVEELSDTFARLGTGGRARVIVLTGAGRAFCAGLDLAGHVQSTMTRRRGPAERLRGQERFAAMVRTIRAIPQPVVAAVNGAAAGAGMALALAADVRVAAASARFHVAAVKIGLSAGECGISYHLPRYVGSSRAFEIMLTGRPVDGAEADRIGLVSRVVDDADLLDRTLDTAEAICSNSPFAVAMTKKIMWANLEAGFDAAIELENRTQILASMTADSAEAMQAFIEKRPPVFTGE
ncbi:enoyl-CoA hydratase-related protein [Frankia sp. Cppng1_Ct_nod]|uniref:enoyl-CoA hydratase/isomerase family protein n=1 Tax=Frankia sp. Cppng1_Ct_nod TaxID=2897162 RepID=UPI00104148D8|nr:enoyl-CoA hydratase-related protein [Frankia sp. Cppng1_Ct_nod]